MNRRGFVSGLVGSGVVLTLGGQSALAEVTRTPRESTSDKENETPNVSMKALATVETDWHKSVGERHELSSWRFKIMAFESHEDAKKAAGEALDNQRRDVLNQSKSSKDSSLGNHPKWARAQIAWYPDGDIQYASQEFAVVENTFYFCEFMGKSDTVYSTYFWIEDVWNRAEPAYTEDELEELLPTEDELAELEPYF